MTIVGGKYFGEMWMQPLVVAATGTFSIKITVVQLSRIIIINIATVWILYVVFLYFSAPRCGRLFRA